MDVVQLGDLHSTYEAIHDPSFDCISDACRYDRDPASVLCKCPVPESCFDRARTLGSRIGSPDPLGAIPSTPKRSSRSGTWRQYCASSVGSDASSFNNDARSAFDVGIEFEIAFEEMIANAARALLPRADRQSGAARARHCRILADALHRRTRSHAASSRLSASA
jgi:hypothetical protein